MKNYWRHGVVKIQWRQKAPWWEQITVLQNFENICILLL